MIYLLIIIAVLVYLAIGYYLDVRRINRMYTKALITIADLQDEIKTHRDSFVCHYAPEDQEWPEVIGR
jgi:hypothetical protein